MMEQLGIPYVKGSETSKEAAKSLLGGVDSIRRQVYELFVMHLEGLTDDGIECILGLRHQTASARRRELVLLGLIEDSGERRLTRSGRKAIVWRVK